MSHEILKQYSFISFLVSLVERKFDVIIFCRSTTVSMNAKLSALYTRGNGRVTFVDFESYILSTKALLRSNVRTKW
jgi:hypothetical protein